jgi:hypothetical protein
MHKRLISQLAIIILALSMTRIVGATKDEGYDRVVRLVETHYRVKRKSVPLLMRAAIKGGRTIARIASSSIPELAEAGSVRLAVFEDQDFSRPTASVPFMSPLRATLSTEWSPLVQLISPDDNEQTYIYMREAGEKFKLLVININQRNATVLELKLNPETLIKLIQDPEVMGKTLADEAGSAVP